jgi:hypothetical protein
MKGQKGAKPASAGKTTLRFLCAAVAAVVLLCAAIILFDGAKPPEAEPHAEWISPRPDAALAETGMRPRTTSPAESEVLIRPRLSSALGFGVERPPASRILELMDTRESLSRGEVEELLRALLSHDNGQLANRCRGRSKTRQRRFKTRQRRRIKTRFLAKSHVNGWY